MEGNMEVFAFLAFIIFLAAVVEGIVEYFFGKIVEHVPALQPYNWLLIYVAAAIGVAGTFHYQLDLFSVFASFLNMTITVSAFGITLTGLAVGRGSNYLHDLVEKYFVKPASDPGTPPA
jgi:hypothetical protein